MQNYFELGIPLGIAEAVKESQEYVEKDVLVSIKVDDIVKKPDPPR